MHWCERCRTVKVVPVTRVVMAPPSTDIEEGDIYWSGERIVVVVAVDKNDETGEAVSVTVRSGQDIISMDPSQLEVL